MSLLPASTIMDPSESSDFKGKTEVDCVTHTQMTSCSADRDTNACRSDVNENVHNGSNQVESKEEIGENDSAVCVEEAVKEHYDGNSDDVHSALIADTLHDDKITSTVKDSSASLLGKTISSRFSDNLLKAPFLNLPHFYHVTFIYVFSV